MLLKRISTYWWFQLFGWGILVAISLFFIITLGDPTAVYIKSLVATCIAGLIITHGMRINIHKLRVLHKPIKQQLILFILLTILYAIIFGFTSEGIDYVLGHNPSERAAKFSRTTRLLLSSFNALWLILMWNFVYFIYHYVQRNRQQELDTFRLQAVVKSLELKTIKSHINPHFIFNALNSIRALVDENPTRARTAITELSNILRSSLQVEQEETVTLAQEVNIVNDYLALEQIRFEERLKVKMDIDPDTLTQPIPPMMLQTLVENAIKHGISKQIQGGCISIKSTFEGNNLELSIKNTGNLNGATNRTDGFGIRSTKERLNLMYNGKAKFDIQETAPNMVETVITMPAAILL